MKPNHQCFMNMIKCNCKCSSFKSKNKQKFICETQNYFFFRRHLAQNFLVINKNLVSFDFSLCEEEFDICSRKMLIVCESKWSNRFLSYFKSVKKFKTNINSSIESSIFCKMKIEFQVSWR